MKNYTIIFISALFLMGCSSTYTIKDFSSKDEFCQSFNTRVGSKDIDITLSDNSSRTIYGGGILKHDTLYTLTEVFPVDLVKSVKYNAKGDKGSVPVGMLCGVIVGGAVALSTYKSVQRLGDNEGPYQFYEFVLMGTGVLVGGITGYFLGWNTTYQFNL
jgi:hypothetical protein